MNRLLGLAAAVLAAVALLWVIGRSLVSDAIVEPAPYVDVTRQRFPDHDENEPAARFLSTVARLNEATLRRQREAEVDYVRQQVASPAADTDPPPPALATFLRQNATTIHTLRAELVSNPGPVWKQRAGDLPDPPQPDDTLLTGTMLMFAADALAQHNMHNDAAAWSDLGAIWVLARSLWVRPEITSVAVALVGSRYITAVASKLPAPPPKWWNDYLAINPRPPFLHALEYDAWAMRVRAERFPAGEPDEEDPWHDTLRRAAEPFLWPVQVYAANRRVRAIRESIRQIAVAEPCVPVETEVLGRWAWALRRMDRFLVEREGVAKLIAIEQQRLASGAWPSQIDQRSVCRDARWDYRRNGDSIELSFTGHIPTPQTGIVTPLTYRR